jgi:hypothetical protein
MVPTQPPVKCVPIFREIRNKFNEILSVGAELFHMDGQTDMTKIIVTFRTLTKAHENISGKSCRENQNMHFMFNNLFSKIILFMR